MQTRSWRLTLISLGCSHKVCSSCISEYLRYHFSVTKQVFHVRSSAHKEKDALVVHVHELLGVPCPCTGCLHVLTASDIQNYGDTNSFEKFNRFAFEKAVDDMRHELTACARCGYILQENCLCANADCRKEELRVRARAEKFRLKKEAEEKLMQRFIVPGVKCCPKCYFEIEKKWRLRSHALLSLSHSFQLGSCTSLRPQQRVVHSTKEKDNCFFLNGIFCSHNIFCRHICSHHFCSWDWQALRLPMRTSQSLGNCIYNV